MDANVIFAASLGGNTFHILEKLEGRADLWVTEETHERVKELTPMVAQKRDVDPTTMLAILENLPIDPHPRSFYKSQIKKATELIGERDKKDVDILALTLKLRCPIWTNDKDFQIPQIKEIVKVYTTEDILKTFSMYWPVRAKFSDGYFELSPSPPAVQRRVPSKTPISLIHKKV